MGLLLIRLVTGTTLVVLGVTALMDRAAIGPALLDVLSAALGLLLIVGLWTPIAGGLAAAYAFASAGALPGCRWYCIIVGVLSAALVLLGPGAWSVDARLFGWKRLEVRDPKKTDPPSF